MSQVQVKKVALLPWHQGWFVRSGQNPTQVEFVVYHVLHIGQENSVGLHLGANGGYQVPLQVFKWLGWLSCTQGPLIHLDTTIHQTLLFRS